MAIKIREKRIIEGKEYEVEVYKMISGKLLTRDEQEKADKFDKFLSEEILKIESEMEKKGLLELKGKRGKVLRLWYEVGIKLRQFLEVHPVDPEEKNFFFRAIYDHVEKLNPGILTKRVLRDPETSHFSYCYQLSGFTWDFVSSVGDWTSWSEFFDRKETRNDQRIIEWLGEKALMENIRSRQNWLRPLTKNIHKVFYKRDTSLLSKEELYKELDKIFKDSKKELEK